MFLVSLIGVFLWLRIENERMLALFQQSKVCDSKIPEQSQENCREVITATVRQVSFIYSGRRTNRYGGSPSRNEIAAFDLDLVMPDGSIAALQISKFTVSMLCIKKAKI